MGLGTKIKSALHGDGHSRSGSASSYEDGRLPGSYPSDGTNNTATNPSTTAKPSTTSNGLNSTTKTNDVNTHPSTLKKGGHHTKTDSGVDFADGPGRSKDVHTNNLTGGDYQRPVSREGGIGNIDNHTSSTKKNDPYWGNIKQSGYERDLPHRPANQVDRDLNSAENGAYGSGLNSNTRDGMVHDNARSSNAGPHSSNMMNKADPRVDSDLDHRAANGAYNGTAGNNYNPRGGSMLLDGTTSTQGLGSTNQGPHNSNMLNKADPRVDSDVDHRATNNYGSNTTGYGSSMLGNGSSMTGNGSNTTGYGSNSRGGMLDGTTGTQGLGSTNQGPHNSNMLNKADPRVDSDVDHRATNNYGSSTTGNNSSMLGNGSSMLGNGSSMTGNGTGRDVHGTNLTTHGGSNDINGTAGRRSDLHNVGLAHPNEPVLGEHHDDRLRARDNGYSPVTGGMGGSKPHHASLADRHHEEDLRDAGLYNHRNSRGSHEGYNRNGGVGGAATNNTTDGNGNVMYGRSASTRNSPQNGSFGHGVGGGPQQQSSDSNSSHFVPRVMHTCSNCGTDNDISRYFRSDVSYRLG
ncbi:hypothetical protein PpBr36_07944 [Pyricularia pennisetigena]|uniref:hypothetical protein n=1 Tax=Pyricularia pennisetigena TaxID=1578925 RepID=UPI00114FC4A8|nr:hypothetical protein PpBr36_07944 [Pyricularia pennisetigena]TLS25722.1 hypothetical protein PpBr36_07944 [Pyricularia pennisetigena]